MDQPSLYLQPGDLPDQLQISEIHWLDLRDMAPKFPTPQAATIVSLLLQGESTNHSGITTYYYPDEETAKEVYRTLVESESLSRQPLPEPGIGQEADLFKPQEAGIGVVTYFLQCHSLVKLYLDPPLSETDALHYAGRLAERLAAVDCNGASEIPLLTPAPTEISATPGVTAPIQSVITPTMNLLPDPDGTTTIRAYSFSDALHGWLALGADIYDTSDGGQTWTLQTHTDSQVIAITFSDQKSGWIEMANGYLQTEDGGHTWRKVNNLPVQLPAPMPAPRTLDFYGEGTYDFCKDKNAPFAGPFFALDEKTGWAYCTSRGDTHYMVSLLYRTNDGGLSWQLLGQAPHGRFGQPDLIFLDQQHGWIGTTGGLYATQDGGVTWSDLHAVSDSEDNAGQVLFLSPEAGFVIVSGPSNWGGILMRTDDAGATWRELYVAPKPAAWPYGPVLFFSDGSGLGGINPLLTTQDQGRTWAAISSIPLNQTIRCDFSWPGRYSFIDRQDGWYADDCVRDGQSIIFHTVDGGVTWNMISPSSPFDDGILGISFVDAHTGYATTESGLLLKTMNGGANFVPVDNLRIHTPEIYFLTAQQGWENRGGSLFESQDGGKTWSQLNLSFMVQGFTFLPDGSGWVIAGETASAGNPHPDRLLMKTIDGGRTWNEFRIGNIPSNWRYPTLDMIQFTDELNGWLLADHYLYFTDDGGESWTQLH